MKLLQILILKVRNLLAYLLMQNAMQMPVELLVQSLEWMLCGLNLVSDLSSAQFPAQMLLNGQELQQCDLIAEIAKQPDLV